MTHGPGEQYLKKLAPKPPPNVNRSRRGTWAETELVESSSFSESSSDGSLQSDSEPEEPAWREPEGGEPAPNEPACGNRGGPMEDIYRR